MTGPIAPRDVDWSDAANQAANDPGDEAIIIVIRAWQEHHPDAPFRATFTVQVADSEPTRHVVGTVNDLCQAIRVSLAELEAPA
jgi:hypothetical protein